MSTTERRLKLSEFLGQIGRAAAQSQVECIKHYCETVLSRNDLDVVIPLGDREIQVDGIALLPNQIPQLESLSIETETDISIGYDEDMELNPEGVVEHLGPACLVKGIWIEGGKLMLGLYTMSNTGMSAGCQVRIKGSNYNDGLHVIERIDDELMCLYLDTVGTTPESGGEENGITVAVVLPEGHVNLDMGMTTGLHQRSAHVKIKAKFTGTGSLEAFEILRDQANVELRDSL